MRLGTKSLLFGVHSFWCHPFFVALSWWKLYGFPWDYRLWVAFLVHDWGYWGCEHMDDEKGEQHPIFGARIMGRFFGPVWFGQCLRHSRFLARSLGAEPSALCWADKLAFCTTPKWLYLLQANLTGEIKEYQVSGSRGEVADQDPARWYRKTYYRMLRITAKGSKQWRVKQLQNRQSRGIRLTSVTTD